MNLLSPSGWFADETMVVSAKAGVSVGPSAYDTIPSSLLRAPRNLLAAYDQATYYVALGARRAMREGETQAANALLSDLDQLVAEGTTIEGDVGWVCSTLGVGCPRGGSARVLADAIDAVDSSGLNAGDTVEIRSRLVGNRRELQLRQALPVVAAIGAGVAFGMWWRRS
jgi:hypothetical protein